MSWKSLIPFVSETTETSNTEATSGNDYASIKWEPVSEWPPQPDGADSFLAERPKRIILEERLNAWKGVRKGVAALHIPEGSRAVVGPTKCRAESAFVEQIYDVNWQINGTGIETRKRSGSINDRLFIYHTGEFVTPDGFDTSIKQCSNGIHFFTELEGAIQFYLNMMNVPIRDRETLADAKDKILQQVRRKHGLQVQ